MKEKKYSIIQGYRSRQKYLVGILGILFITAALFSCDMQDLGTNANQNLENNYRSTSTSDQSDFNNTVQPYTFTHNLSDSVPVVTMPPVEVQTLLSEDRAEPQQNRSPVPPRFGKALEVSIDSENKGRWDELTNGDRLWRLRIASGGAYCINLIFDRFELPPGGKLFIYNEDQSTVLGPFNEEHNKSSGRFSTLPVSGAQITLEYYEPGGQWDNTELRIANVIHAYRNIFGRDNENSTLDLGDSGSCNINVNCPSALGWQDESRSVAMVLVDQNTRLCSGALVNNVLEDRTPYFLSAFHCADRLTPNGSLSSAEIADAEDWLFWFNYKSETCSDPNSEPGHNAVSGASFRAANSDSDFLLLELSNIPPQA
ncbi:hypothetical protein SAMN05443144_110108 [Fodinibius roseus]|uniref:Trypsin n=1 Tax=Fodinibius roseus TaxID=1194090 RepID=A0A1M5CVW7_9BACT|nr:hypothetical protein [Fodinibius roseus]SHF58884.1 hypothetical protein SAMN05443144_110108 [Fodinibius roseus]